MLYSVKVNVVSGVSIQLCLKDISSRKRRSGSCGGSGSVGPGGGVGGGGCGGGCSGDVGGCGNSAGGGGASLKALYICLKISFSF